jgi:hypothetical protein
MIQGVSGLGAGSGMAASGQISQVPAMPSEGFTSSLSVQGTSSADVFRAALIGLLLGGKDKEDDTSNLLAGLLLMGMQPGSYSMEFSQSWSSAASAYAAGSGQVAACGFNATA